jgi:hypothetical protein
MTQQFDESLRDLENMSACTRSSHPLSLNDIKTPVKPRSSIRASPKRGVALDELQSALSMYSADVSALRERCNAAESRLQYPPPLSL